MIRTTDTGVLGLLASMSFTVYITLLTGQPYYYKVRAYRQVGGKKVYSGFTEVVDTTPGTAP